MGGPPDLPLPGEGSGVRREGPGFSLGFPLRFALGISLIFGPRDRARAGSGSGSGVGVNPGPGIRTGPTKTPCHLPHRGDTGVPV
ncbi:hypothetical protein GCM10017688_49200 [Streptomyces ramulosus]